MTPVLGAHDRLEELAVLHLNAEAGNGCALHDEVDRLAHPALAPEQVWAAFEDLVEAVRLRDGINDQIVRWDEVDDELTGPDRSEAAFQIACQRVDAALQRLLPGAP
jgi:hypothetical protein